MCTNRTSSKVSVMVYVNIYTRS